MVEDSCVAMGTVIDIKALSRSGDDAAIVRKALSAAMEEIRRIEDIFSVYDSKSEIAHVNRLAAGVRLRLSDEAYDLIRSALEFSEKTSGSFDITVKPLVDVWAKSREENRLPSPERIKEALSKVGCRSVALDPSSRTIAFRKNGMGLDLGGMAKGYAVDRAVAVLKMRGVKNAIVNAGGNIYCMGMRSKGRRWKIGIRNPRNKDLTVMTMFLKDNAVSTSGDYVRYFMLDGRRYSHIIDPRTGYPIQSGAISASIVAPDAASADAFSTAACVLGEGSLGMLQANGLDAVLIFAEGNKLRAFFTKGFRGKYGVMDEDINAA